jgi:hypothetical protein
MLLPAEQCLQLGDAGRAQRLANAHHLFDKMPQRG